MALLVWVSRYDKCSVNIHNYTNLEKALFPMINPLTFRDSSSHNLCARVSVTIPRNLVDLDPKLHFIELDRLRAGSTSPRGKHNHVFVKIPSTTTPQLAKVNFLVKDNSISSILQRENMDRLGSGPSFRHNLYE